MYQIRTGEEKHMTEDTLKTKLCVAYVRQYWFSSHCLFLSTISGEIMAAQAHRVHVL